MADIEKLLDINKRIDECKHKDKQLFEKYKYYMSPGVTDVESITMRTMLLVSMANNLRVLADMYLEKDALIKA